MSGLPSRTQLFRYLMVGMGSNVVLYLCYIALTEMGAGHKTAMTLLYAVGVAQTFYFNKKWSFKHDGPARRAFVRYALAYVAGYILNLGMLWLGVDWLQLPHQAVQAVAIVVVALSLFLMHKYWVFAPELRRSPA